MKEFILSKLNVFKKSFLSNAAVIILVLFATLFLTISYIAEEGFLFQLFNSLSISIYVVVLIDIIWRWDNTEKMISRIFNAGMPYFVQRMNEQGLQEAVLAAIFPKHVGEEIIQDTEIKKYATAAINSFKDSLSDCQFYETVDYLFNVRMEEFVIVDITCTEHIRRFGGVPFKIHHENDDGVDVENVCLCFGDTNLSMGEDFIIEKTVDEKERMLNQDSRGWKIVFKKDWKEHEVLTVKYSMHFSDYDHWTEINWAANHPIRKMRATVVCRDGLSLKESAEVTDKNHKIKIEPNDANDIIRISSDWLMPGQGYVLVISNQEKRAAIPVSGVERGVEKHLDNLPV